MKNLEQHYSRLVRICYPAAYRRVRGPEIVGTYLELAAPDQRRPTARDVADLVQGGLRQHRRAAAATGLRPGLRLAGPLALLATTALAVFEMPVDAYASLIGEGPQTEAGSFLAIACWALWLFAAVLLAVLPGRFARHTVGTATVVTAGLIPLAAVTGLQRPALFVLLPVLALGAVAFAGVRRLPWWGRLAPLAVGVAVAIGTTNPLRRNNSEYGSYDELTTSGLSVIGGALLALTLLLAIVLAVRGDHRGGWALLVLLGPIGLFFVRDPAETLAFAVGHTPQSEWWSLVAAASVVTIVGPALLMLTLAARQRLAKSAAQ
ncbi:hypothetical protein [Actinoplanes sp. NPDC051859]|uniref:hypothetical protein n=1 Tax=Actinoplanes sp. NPDC051859 TaxID=3363909 RepID=UPI0037A95E3A